MGGETVSPEKRPARAVVDTQALGTQRHRAVEFTTVVALVVCLLALTTGPLYVFAVRVLGAAPDWESGAIKWGFILASALGAAAFVLQAVTGGIRRPGIGVVLGGAFTALAVLSTTWSILAGQTLWRSAVYVGLWLTAWCLTSLPFRTVLSVMVGFSSIGVAASWAAVLVRPAVGLADNGDWRGVYTSPNSLGPVCAVLVLSLVALAIVHRNKVTYIAVGCGVVLAAIPLQRSGADTAMIALAISVAAATAVTVIGATARRGHRQAALGAFGVCVLGATAALLTVGGRVWNAHSLAQRREVWSLVRERIAIRPWDGYGFFTYWDTNASRSPRLLARVGSAHNSVLEAALGVGVFGSLIVAVMMVAAVARNLVHAARSTAAVSWFGLALGVFVVLEHVTESFVSWFSYLWVLLIVVIDLVPRATSDAGVEVLGSVEVPGSEEAAHGV